MGKANGALKRGVSDLFKEPVVAHPVVISGGFSKGQLVLKTVRVEGVRFGQILQYDDWLPPFVSGKSRKEVLLRDSGVWRAVAAGVHRAELSQGGRAHAGSDEKNDDDPFGRVLLSAAADAPKRKKTIKSAFFSPVSVRMPEIGSLPAAPVSVLANASSSDKELWIDEADIPAFLTRLHAEYVGQSFAEPDPVTGKPVWESASKAWVVRWKDDAGEMREERCKAACRSYERKNRGEPLTPTSFLMAKRRAYSRVKKLSRDAGCTDLSSESSQSQDEDR